MGFLAHFLNRIAAVLFLKVIEVQIVNALLGSMDRLFQIN
jgi:hypothetical protein